VVAADSSNVYWIDPGDGTVNSAAAVDTPTIVHLATGQAGLSDLVIDDLYLYWSNRLGGAVMRVAKSGGTPSVVSAATEPLLVAVDDAYLYWNDSTGIWRAPKGGGAATNVVTFSTSPTAPTTLGCADGVLGLSVGATNVFFPCVFSTGSQLWTAPKDGSGSPSSIFSKTSVCAVRFGPLFLDEDEKVLYFGVNDCSGYPSSAAVKEDGSFARDYPTWPISFASDARFVYDTDGYSPYTLNRIPKCGAPTVQRVAYDPTHSVAYGGHSLAVDDRYLYWPQGASIFRTPK
jgi:hypothetical protein